MKSLACGRLLLLGALGLAGCSGNGHSPAAGGRHDVGVHLVPTPVTVTAQLAVNVDVPGIDPALCRYVWRVDGATIPGAESNVLDPEQFRYGRVVSVEVIVPATADGAPRSLKAEAQITNAPPVVRGLAVRPDLSRGGAELTANPECWDPDGDVVTCDYRWFRNGQSLEGQTGTTLAIQSFARGDRIEVEATAKDREHRSEPKRSDAYVIENRAPRFAEQSPTISTSEDRVRFQAAATDVDGDAVRFELAQAPDGMTITASGAVEWALPARDQRRDEYSVTLRAVDGRGGEATQTLVIRVSARGTQAS